MTDYSVPALVSLNQIEKMRAGETVEAHETLRHLKTPQDLAAFIDAQNATINTLADVIDQRSARDNTLGSAGILASIREGIGNGIAEIPDE